MEKQNACHEAEALAVSYFLVQKRVGLQDVVKGQLACSELGREVRVRWKSSPWEKNTGQDSIHGAHALEKQHAIGQGC